MPNIIVSLSNLEASVERPVIFDIIRQVMDITQISSKTPIRFYGEEAKGAQKNSLINEEGSGENRWNYDEKVFVEVDEDFDHARLLSSAVKEPENIQIFRDPLLGVSIKPVYGSSLIALSFKYRSRDKNAANRWRNEMRARCSMMRGVNIHQITYHYQIPPKLLMLVGEIHRLRELQAGYGDNFNEYLATNLSTRAQLVGALDGRHVNWTIGETQGRIQGYFEFEGIPDKPEKDGEHDAYTASFTYKFAYDKPTHCAMLYPIVVHQQLLDTHWRPREKIVPTTERPKTYSSSALSFHKFETDRQALEIQANDGLDLPDFDEFIPGKIMPGTLRIFTGLCFITQEDKKNLLNFGELGEDFSMDSDVLEFIAKSEAPFMHKPYHSILNVGLYEEKSLKDPYALRVGEDLSVYAVKDLSMRSVWRVRLSMVGDLSLLTQEALDRLKNWPRAAEKILNAINAALSNKGGQKDLNGNQLSHDALCDVGFHYENTDKQYSRSALPAEPGTMRTYQIVAGPCQCAGGDYPIRKSPCYTGSLVRMNLVQTLFVVARPMSQYPADVDNNVFVRTQAS